MPQKVWEHEFRVSEPIGKGRKVLVILPVARWDTETGGSLEAHLAYVANEVPGHFLPLECCMEVNGESGATPNPHSPNSPVSTHAPSAPQSPGSYWYRVGASKPRCSD